MSAKRTPGSGAVMGFVLLASLLAGVLLPPVVAAQDEAADPLPAAGTALRPGRYVSDVLGPRIEFQAQDGWLLGAMPEGGPILTLERTDPPGAVLTITRFDGEAFAGSCDPTSLTQVDPSARRIIEIIAGNPYLVAAPARPIEVSGFSGRSLDVAVPPVEDCPLPFLLIWALPMEDGEYVQVAGQQSRFIALDVEGTVLVIAIESLPGVPFGGLLEASMDLVASMRIEPASVVSKEGPSPPAPAPTSDVSTTPGVSGLEVPPGSAHEAEAETTP